MSDGATWKPEDDLVRYREPRKIGPPGPDGGRVCQDPDCEHKGIAQPIEEFRPSPRNPEIRVWTCASCYSRKLSKPRVRTPTEKPAAKYAGTLHGNSKVFKRMLQEGIDSRKDDDDE